MTRIDAIKALLAMENGREIGEALGLTQGDFDQAEDKSADELLDELWRAAQAANSGVSETRRESLQLAIAAGADRATLDQLAEAVRLSRQSTIKLPRGKYEHCSRGKGWARKGRGADAEWGENTGSGYVVGPGRWTVGSNDGFNRKSSEQWDVVNVTVGTEIWTVAS